MGVMESNKILWQYYYVLRSYSLENEQQLDMWLININSDLLLLITLINNILYSVYYVYRKLYQMVLWRFSSHPPVIQ